VSDNVSAEDEALFGEAFSAGYDAFIAGEDELDNPFDKPPHETAWQVGWEKAKAEGSTT
jgi:ribosome modulation factor